MGNTDRQHVINLHGSSDITDCKVLKDKNFINGEIAVRNAWHAKDSSLYITNSGQTEIAKFIPEILIDDKIKNAKINIHNDEADLKRVNLSYDEVGLKATTLFPFNIDNKNSRMHFDDNKFDRGNSYNVFLFGRKNDILSKYTYIIGDSNKTNKVETRWEQNISRNLYIIGDNNEVGGVNNEIHGNFNNISGFNNFILGESNSIWAEIPEKEISHSFIVGNKNKIKADNQIIFGNECYIEPDSRFIVSNSNIDYNRGNLLDIKFDGKCFLKGIGLYSGEGTDNFSTGFTDTSGAEYTYTEKIKSVSETIKKINNDIEDISGTLSKTRIDYQYKFDELDTLVDNNYNSLNYLAGILYDNEYKVSEIQEQLSGIEELLKKI